MTQLDLPDVFAVDVPVYEDERGWFQELWNPDRLVVAALPRHFVQDNLAFSQHGVLRGLHFQQPFPQGKLIVVLQGRIFDVAVDVRPNSPGFGRWTGQELVGGSGRALYIPEGFAHGYQVLSETAHVLYKCTDVYHPEAEHTLRWNDEDLAIAWPLRDPVLSDKDRRAPTLKETRALLRDLQSR